MFLQLVNQLLLCTRSTNEADNFNWSVPVNGLKSNREDKLHTYHDLLSVGGIVRSIVMILWYSESQGKCKCQKIWGLTEHIPKKGKRRWDGEEALSLAFRGFSERPYISYSYIVPFLCGQAT